MKSRHFLVSRTSHVCVTSLEVVARQPMNSCVATGCSPPRGDKPGPRTLHSCPARLKELLVSPAMQGGASPLKRRFAGRLAPTLAATPPPCQSASVRSFRLRSFAINSALSTFMTCIAPAIGPFFSVGGAAGASPALSPSAQNSEPELPPFSFARWAAAAPTDASDAAILAESPSVALGCVVSVLSVMLVARRWAGVVHVQL